MLEHDEKKRLVQATIDAIHGADTVLSALRTIVGGVESPLADAIYALQDAAIESTASAIGDRYKWLDWFIFDNDCGAKGLEASVDDAPASPVRDIDGLLYIVERS